MNGVLMPLLLTLAKYIFCTKTSKFGNNKISYVQHNAGYDKKLQANSILNRNISKKQLNVCTKNLLVSVTALACAQQEQSTLQNPETWNTTNSKKFLVLKDFRGAWWIQLYSDCQRFITTDAFEADQTLFTNISSESNFQLKEVVKCCPI